MMSPKHGQLLSDRMNGVTSNILQESIFFPQRRIHLSDDAELCLGIEDRKRKLPVNSDFTQTSTKRLRTTLLNRLGSEQFDNSSRDSECSTNSFVFKPSFNKHSSTFSMDSECYSPVISSNEFSGILHPVSDLQPLARHLSTDSVDNFDKSSHESIEYIKQHEVDNTNMTSSTDSLKVKDYQGRNKFSPNVTAKSLSHLINSPLLTMDSISPSTGHKKQQKSSRRSLYRTETHSIFQ